MRAYALGRGSSLVQVYRFALVDGPGGARAFVARLSLAIAL